MVDVPDTPKDAGLPPVKFKEWRPYQRDTIARILNSDKRFFVLEATTGSGKSPIGIAVSNLMINRFDKKAKVYYVASTKQLQKQLLIDFPYAKVVKGRANFQCIIDPNLTADDCVFEANGQGARHCPAYRACHYFKQRDEALKAALSVHNYAYFLHAQLAGLFNSCDLLILDEAHLAENQLMNFIAFHFPKSNFDLAETSFPSESREATLETLKGMIPFLKDKISSMEPFIGEGSDPKEVKLLKRYKRLRDKINRFLDYYEKNWLFYYNMDNRKSFKSYVEFKPVWADKFADIFWKPVEEGGKILHMSATIGEVKMHSELLGISPDEVDSIALPSTFPVEHRPIVLRSVGRLSRNHYNDNKDKMIVGIDEIIERHKGEKGIIQTISYKIQQDIVEGSAFSHLMIAPTSDDNKALALEEFELSKDKILVSPAYSVGVDLEGDLARWQIVVKVPFPYLGDEQVRIRQRENDRWYKVQAANTLIQMCGRIVRSYDDYGTTYLLDKNFYWLLNEYRDLFPDWFMASVFQEKLDGRKDGSI